MDPGKKKSPDIFVVNDIYGSQTPKHTEKNDASLFIKRH